MENEKKPKIPARIYSYGAWEPSDPEHVNALMYQAYKYRNTLVDLDLRRRAETDAVVDAFYPEMPGLRAQVEAADKAVTEAVAVLKDANIQARGYVQTVEDKQKIKALKAVVTAAAEAYRKRRKEAFADDRVRQAIKPVNAAAVLRGKKERGSFVKAGGYHGTYLLVEQAARKFGQGPPPVIRPMHSGRIGVQIQGGMSVAELLSGRNTLLRLEPAVDKSHAITESRPRDTLCLRMGSDDRGKPVWCYIPFSYHRPLPEDARIKWCWLLRRRRATHQEWFVQFALTGSADTFAKETVPYGKIAVSFGFRLVPEGLRVASWSGEGGKPMFRNAPDALRECLRLEDRDGARGSLVIPDVALSRWRKSYDLQRIRTGGFDACVGALKGWSKAHAHELPGWHLERFATLPQWKSQRKLAIAALFWRDHRFPGDAKMFAALERWRAHDRHLYEWQINNIVGAQRWREHVYRNFVAEVRRHYGVVHIPHINYANLQQKKSAEDRGFSIDFTQKLRGIANMGRFSSLFREAMSHKLVNPVGISLLCHACGGVSGEAIPGNLIHTCAKCGARWDQDFNAVCNLLRDNIDPIAATKAIAADPAYAFKDMHPRERTRELLQLTVAHIGGLADDHPDDPHGDEDHAGASAGASANSQ